MLIANRTEANCQHQRLVLNTVGLASTGGYKGDVVIDSDLDLVCFEMVGVESSSVIRRSVKFRAITDFLLSAERRPSALVIRGRDRNRQDHHLG